MKSCDEEMKDKIHQLNDPVEVHVLDKRFTHATVWVKSNPIFFFKVKKPTLVWNRNPSFQYQMATSIKFMGRDLGKWKRMQNSKMAAMKRYRFHFLKSIKLNVLF